MAIARVGRRVSLEAAHMSIRERTVWMLENSGHLNGKQSHKPDTNGFLKLKQDVLTISRLYLDVPFSVRPQILVLCVWCVFLLI